jgi:transcriptional regulator with XRE-family HTH domain
MSRTRTYSHVTVEAAELLGKRIKLARRQHRWKLADLAERIGVSQATVSKVERGDLSVGLGVAFEAAAVTGVPLFHADSTYRATEAGRVDDRLAVLPQYVRSPVKIDDDF